MIEFDAQQSDIDAASDIFDENTMADMDILESCGCPTASMLPRVIAYAALLSDAAQRLGMAATTAIYMFADVLPKVQHGGLTAEGI